MKLTSRLLQNRKQKNLNEEPKEKKEEKYRILVVSAEAENNELFHTAQRITDEAKKLGH